MIPIHATISKSIPMRIGGIDHFEIDLHEGVPTCFIGENGSGKSFFQRELTPEPSQSTAYLKGGFKEIVWVHEGKTITTRSEFAEGNKHYFIVEGVNLNEGFTSKTQLELCREYFNLDGAVAQLSQGVVDIRGMGPTQRRQFYLSLYPSDLSFVEQAHKNVSRRIREAKAVRKDLLQRIATVEESALSPEELELLSGNLTLYRDALSRVTSNLSVVDAKLEELPDHPDAISTVYPNTCANIRRLQTELHAKTLGASGMQSSKLRNAIENMTKSLGEHMGRIRGLSSREHQIEEELCELGAKLGDGDNWDIDALENRLLELKKERSTLFVTLDEVKHLSSAVLETSVSRLFSQISSAEVAMLENHVLGKELRELRERVSHNKSTQLTLSHKLGALTATLDNLKTQMAEHGESECIEGCPTREKHVEILQQLEKRANETLIELTDLEKRLSVLETELDADIELLADSETVRTCLEPIHATFTQCYPTEKFVPTLKFIATLGKRVESEQVRLKEARRVNELDNTIKTLEENVQAVKAASGNLDDLVARKELLKVELRETQEAMTAAEEDAVCLKSGITEKKDIVELRARLVSELRTGAEQAKVFCEYSERSRVVELREYLVYVQTKVAQEFRHLQTTYDESQKVNIRLDEELRPALRDVECNLVELMAIEKEVSPKEGVVRDTLCEFINLIFSRTNEFLGVLASYPFVVDYLDPAQELDFKIGVRLQENMTEVPEIKLLSNGQGDLFNFAHYLACMDVRGLGAEYPVKIDEIDAAFSKGHKDRLASLISEIEESGTFRKLIIVNHNQAFYEAISNLQICCLDDSGIVLPRVYNEGVVIERK